VNSEVFPFKKLLSRETGPMRSERETIAANGAKGDCARHAAGKRKTKKARTAKYCAIKKLFLPIGIDAWASGPAA